MKNVTIKLFQFNELSESAKQVAISNLSDINVDYDWWQSTYEDAKNIGLKITSFDLDRNRHAKGLFIDRAENCANKIISEHGINCATYATAHVYLRDFAELLEKYEVEQDGMYFNFRNDATEYDFENEKEDLDEQFLNDICEDYSILLQKECEYLQSEEAIVETIIANDYDFTIDGKIY